MEITRRGRLGKIQAYDSMCYCSNIDYCMSNSASTNACARSHALISIEHCVSVVGPIVCKVVWG